jgi:hypothetical protein
LCGVEDEIDFGEGKAGNLEIELAIEQALSSRARTSRSQPTFRASLLSAIMYARRSAALRCDSRRVGTVVYQEA